jgi:hypothetical protein
LQLLMTLGWTAYALYLPQLAAEVGIPGSAVVWLLLLDQAIFTVTDYATGVAADRVAGVVGRLGRSIAVVSVLSGAAFLALPWLARDHGGAPLFIGCAVVWAASSSALRAPPLALLGKHAARPALPWLASLALVGYGVAGALAPWLTVALRTVDPRWPFFLAGTALVLATFALAPIERSLAAAGPAAAAPEQRPPGAWSGTAFGFTLAVAVFGLGFQIHAGVNSTRFFLQFAGPAELERLTPLFWVGFSIAMVATAPLVGRWGAPTVMGIAGLGAGLFALLALEADGLLPLVIAQLGAGTAWGGVMASGLAAALALGAPGAEGRTVGLFYAALAVATVARMAMAAGGLAADPAYAPFLAWTPVAAWGCGGAGMLVLARRRRSPV